MVTMLVGGGERELENCQDELKSDSRAEEDSWVRHSAPKSLTDFIQNLSSSILDLFRY